MKIPSQFNSHTIKVIQKELYNKIVCVPNKEERLLYKVSIFDVDDIMSDNWELCL